MKTIHHKHDHFFCQAMSNIALARDFFKANLPERIHAQCDLSSLSLVSNKFVKSDLTKREVDVLYQTKLKSGDKAYLYVLCEHQTNVDKDMVLRLHEYMHLIIRRHMTLFKTNKPPIIFPIILYSGISAWRGHRNFYELYGESEWLAKELAFAPFELIDLQRIDDDMGEQALAKLMMYLIKHKKVHDLKAYLRELVPLLIKARMQVSSNFMEIMLTYVYQNLETEQLKEFDEMAQAQFTGEVKQAAMTVGEYLRQQGRLEGRQEGRQEGRLEGLKSVAQNLYQSGYELGDISRLTGLALDILRAELL